MAAQRGLDASNEQDPGLLIRDTRTLGQRFVDVLKNPVAVAVLMITFAVGNFFASHLSDLLLVLGVVSFTFAVTRKARLPFRLPLRAKVRDHGDLIPGINKPRMAEGIYYFGNEKKTDQELWFSNTDMRTHVLIFGSTGSGKTETLISLAFNALVQGSGFIYVDGKGDNALYAKIFSIVRYMGRGDDILLINFMTGARDIIGPQEKRISNTLNPFSTGSSSMLSQLIVSMMDSGSSSGDGDMWKGRAIAFVEALMKVLVAMRDAGHILLDANSIRNYFSLERIQAMVEYKSFIRDDQPAISLESLPSVVMEPIKNYLVNLPGYNKERKNQQVSQVFEQHGFITMQLTRVFTSLADTYGHILRTKLAEVDLKDVVLNRRILVVLLPALEKSPDELANLGKVIIASLKAMMAAGLGDEVEGDYRDLVERKPTNAPTPYLCILDEYGYYAVKGFAVVPAQARSLGFSVVFAGQDLPAFQKASKEEAASIGANTNIKICMKLEDPQETWEFFMKSAGESYVAHVGGFQSNAGGMTSTYMDTKSASLEKRARVDLLDLKEQVEGDAHIFFKSKIVRARMFYANPPAVKALRLNQSLKVDMPRDSELYVLVKGIEDCDEFVRTGNLAIPAPAASETIHTLVELFQEQQQPSSVESGIGLLLAYHDRVKPEKLETSDAIEVAEDALTAFTSIEMPAHLKQMLFDDDVDRYSQPMLEKSLLHERLLYLERLFGSGETYAANIAEVLVSDISAATQYPPSIESMPQAEILSKLVVDVVEHINLRKQQIKEKSRDDKGS